jgi:hypothetical protein
MAQQLAAMPPAQQLAALAAGGVRLPGPTQCEAAWS